MRNKKQESGFTIVEVLIVVAVISILFAIIVIAYSAVLTRSRDTTRAADMATIKKALDSYSVLNGGLRRTSGGAASYTNGVTYTGWDSSVSPNWLAFLRDSSGMMPIDPTNTITTANNPPNTNNRNYFYYCYAAGGGPLPATSNVRIGYHKEDNSLVTIDFAVKACLP